MLIYKPKKSPHFSRIEFSQTFSTEFCILEPVHGKNPIIQWQKCTKTNIMFIYLTQTLTLTLILTLTPTLICNFAF